ncbi:uncharacterized protein Cad96Ca [Panulirus ornatus]|uniref:uncharacterized protein Cad96Ca n=1 Tax=Panulirus ornatus TaxID=150431 RepID=UPI003A873AE1
MDLHHIYWLTAFLLLATGVAANNSPPILRSNKDWLVTEDGMVGDLVTRLAAFDREEDPVVFTLEPQRQGDTVHQYFEIDKENNVRIARPLTGMAGNDTKFYMLRVRVDDGHTDPVTEIRLQVLKASKGGGSQQNFHLRGLGGSGAFGGPFASGGNGSFTGQNASPFNYHDPGFVPPVLIVKRPWVVRSDTPLGTMVSRVVVHVPAEENYNLTLHDPQKLLRLDPDSGNVTVAYPLLQKVGNHSLMVIASNHHGPVSEPVVLYVLPPLPPTTSSHIPGVGTKTQQDLLVVGGNVHTASLGDGFRPSTGTSTELPGKVPEPDISLTVIPIMVVVGVSPLIMVIYYCWRKQRRKALAESKESAVVYSDKGEEAAATEITPVEPRQRSDGSSRKGSTILRLAALWQRRAQSNKYEDTILGSRNRGKRKISELSATTADVWEFPRHHLKVLGILGEGCFGQVWKCEAVGLKGEGSMLVAVKTLKESAGERERRDLIQELKVLKNLGHHTNVVSLLGCCTEKDPIFVILEYMIGGKLQSYLRASRADTAYKNLHGSSSSLTPKDLTVFTYQIARGMEFLARNGIIHRDLAARNVLVGEDKMCKVADFGFARDVANNHIYERKSDGRLPIRWMAPESLFDNIFITKSDVWSFGVLLWEIVTLGSTPYPGMGAAEVMRKVKEGYRLEKPDHCRRELYNIMYYCWDKDPKERPSFTELVHTLEGILMSEVEYIELDRFPDHTYYNVITEKNDELL